MASEFSPEDAIDVWQQQSPEPFRMSSDDIRTKITHLDEKTHKRNVSGYIGLFIVIAGFTGFLFLFTTPVQLIGSFLTILGAGYQIFELRRDQLLKPSAATTAAGKADTSIDFYRADLERQRDFHRGIQFWSRLVTFIPGPVVFCVGIALAQPRSAWFFYMPAAMFVISGALAIPENLKLAREYQRQIDEVDRFQREQ